MLSERWMPAHFNVFRVIVGIVVEFLQQALVVILPLVGELPQPILIYVLDLLAHRPHCKLGVRRRNWGASSTHGDVLFHCPEGDDLVNEVLKASKKKTPRLVIDVLKVC